MQKKMLLLLAGGVALGFIRSPYRCKKIMKALQREWTHVNRQTVARAIRNLYTNKMVDCRENEKGETTMILNDAGKKRVLRYTIEDMKITKPKTWDKKWRIVLFDIPETMKDARNILRERLRLLDFRELQKSVFVFPYECRDEIDFLIEFYGIRRYVRQMIVQSIDNELHLKKKFDL